MGKISLDRNIIIIILFVFNLGSCGLWLYVITEAMIGGGRVCLDFNRYNEMVLEYVVIWVILIFISILAVYEFNKEWKRFKEGVRNGRR